MNASKLDHALHYANLNIPVFPLHYIKPGGTCSCGGKAVNKTCKAGKHPYGQLVPHGLKDASTDPQIVQKWFDNTPYNIAVVTGTASNFFILDRDDRDGGKITLESWEKEHGILPDTLTQTTGNGVHYTFKMPGDVDVRNSQKQLAMGIDVRGSGGYICAAPSIHENGNQYEWVNCDLLDISKIATAPFWLIEKIQTASIKSNGSTNGASYLTLMETPFTLPSNVRDGEGREITLLKYAGYLRGKGLDQASIERILLDYNRQNITPLLSNDEVLSRARRYEFTPQPNTENSADTNWPNPQPLSEKLPPVPEFYPRLLPKQLSDYAQDIAARMSCPVDFPAIGIIVALSAALGARTHCRPYVNGTWLVPSGAWGIIISPPGATKSPPLQEILNPLRTLDKNAANKYQTDVNTYLLSKAIFDKNFKQAVKAGNTAGVSTPPAEPQMKRYLINDSTYEMLVSVCAANPNGILIWRDELMGWFHSLAKEGQKEARGLYLTGWGGMDGYATDRIGRGHLRAERVNLSILGTIQPNVLRHIVQDAVSGTSGDDGLIQRFQLAVFPDRERHFKKTDRCPNQTAMNHYKALIERFATLNPASIGASLTTEGNAYLPFDKAAQEIYDEWLEVLEDRIRDPETELHPAMLSHLGKYRSLFPKLALVLHLADGDTGAITANAAVRAKCWAIYLESHAKRIYHNGTNQAMLSSVALANKIKAGKLENGFTRSTVLLREWSGLRTGEEVRTATTILQDMKWLVMKENRSTGGRPSEHFFINPKVPQRDR